MRLIEEGMDKKRIAFYSKRELKIVKRCIHTSADFDYQYNMIFSKDVVGNAFEIFKRGAVVVCDTAMAAAGINKRVLVELNSELISFIDD